MTCQGRRTIIRSPSGPLSESSDPRIQHQDRPGPEQIFPLSAYLAPDRDPQHPCQDFTVPFRIQVAVGAIPRLL